MMEELDDEYSGDPNTEIPSAMCYPHQISYGPMDKHLPDGVKRIRGRSSQHLNRVEKYLERFNRVLIPTDTGNNNLVRAIKIQLHTPKNFTDDMMRHQLGYYFIESVDFLFPKMKSYLRSKKLTYSSYVMGVCNGLIWGDEFMIAAIGKMYNVRITVVSPYFSDVWNVFHDGGAKPDIVLVCNGLGFGNERDNITHFIATKGKEQTWKCVGADQPLSEIGLYSGYTEGCKSAIDLFTITKNRDILFNTTSMLHDMNQLCHDVKAICVHCDKLIDDMKRLNIKLGNFQ